MRRPRRPNRSLVIALYLNAGLLAVLVAVLLSRGPSGSGVAMATPGQLPPVAGGNGVFLMPAQFTVNNWGFYLLDTDMQTVSAYQYLPGSPALRLVAAREFRSDRKLKRFNTSPNPEEIERLVQIEQNPLRGRDVIPAPPPEIRTPETNPDNADPKPGPGPLIVPDPKLIAPDDRSPATKPVDETKLTPVPASTGAIGDKTEAPR